MTLQRAGWIDDRPFAVVPDDAGKADKYVCLKCGSETVADAAAFTAHQCHKQRRKTRS